ASSEPFTNCAQVRVFAGICTIRLQGMVKTIPLRVTVPPHVSGSAEQPVPSSGPALSIRPVSSKPCRLAVATANGGSARGGADHGETAPCGDVAVPPPPPPLAVAAPTPETVAKVMTSINATHHLILLNWGILMFFLLTVLICSHGMCCARSAPPWGGPGSSSESVGTERGNCPRARERPTRSAF